MIFEPTVAATFLGVWSIISLILAVAGGAIVYFIFLNEKKAKKYKGFVKWLYEFTAFKNLTAEVIVKASYIVLAIYTTLVAFGFIGTSAWLFFETLIIENLILRVICELLLMFISIYKNIKEMNQKK